MTTQKTSARTRALVAIALAIVMFGLNPSTGESQDGQDQGLIAALADRQTAARAASVVRKTSDLNSTLDSRELDDRLGRLLQWMVRDFANSGTLQLLSAVPSGTNAKGQGNDHLRKLKSTYWLQDNALYGAGAFQQYAPPLGQILSESLRRKWDEKFPQFCPDTESGIVVGTLPAYDGGAGSGESRCSNLPRPDAWQMLRMRQYPPPSEASFDALETPIVGTDYPAAANGNSPEIGEIGHDSPRNLLKYGCLRQVMLGNTTLASEMFDLALAKWDGNGFQDTNRRKNKDGKELKGVYWTRDVAFALLCANALGQGGQDKLGHRTQVSKAQLEDAIWATQAREGGIWTNYCKDEAGHDCSGGLIPKFSKQTNEIAPLVLLIYGRNIWAPK